MKNTGLLLQSSFSLNRAALTAMSETARYTKSVSPDLGLTRTGSSARYCLITLLIPSDPVDPLEGGEE